MNEKDIRIEQGEAAPSVQIYLSYTTQLVQKDNVREFQEHLSTKVSFGWDAQQLEAFRGALDETCLRCEAFGK